MRVGSWRWTSDPASRGSAQSGFFVVVSVGRQALGGSGRNWSWGFGVSRSARTHVCCYMARPPSAFCYVRKRDTIYKLPFRSRRVVYDNLKHFTTSTPLFTIISHNWPCLEVSILEIMQGGGDGGKVTLSSTLDNPPSSRTLGFMPIVTGRTSQARDATVAPRARFIDLKKKMDT